MESIDILNYICIKLSFRNFLYGNLIKKRRDSKILIAKNVIKYFIWSYLRKNRIDKGLVLYGPVNWYEHVRLWTLLYNIYVTAGFRTFPEAKFVACQARWTKRTLVATQGLKKIWTQIGPGMGKGRDGTIREQSRESRHIYVKLYKKKKNP